MGGPGFKNDAGGATIFADSRRVSPHAWTEETHWRPHHRTRTGAGLKRGVWGESRLGFSESIVEEVRRFVAGMPPVDSTTGSACFPWNFSALRDRRAGILPVPRPPVLSAGGRCVTRLTRILMFPFFSSQHLGPAPPTPEVPSKMPRELSWKLEQDTLFNRPVNLVSILRNKKSATKGDQWLAACHMLRSERENKVRLGRQQCLEQGQRSWRSGLRGEKRA